MHCQMMESIKNGTENVFMEKSTKQTFPNCPFLCGKSALRELDTLKF